MNRDYNKELDDFYDNVYRPCMKKNGDILDDFEFGIDGLLNRPAGVVGGRESRLWDNSKLKILFLLKEINANDSFTNSRFYERINEDFGHNIAAWIYGLYGAYELHKVPSKDEAYAANNQNEYFQKKPFGIINLKKKVGGAQCNEDIVLQYICRYKDFIKQEIEILRPNIILCCGYLKKNSIYEITKSIFSNYKFESKGTKDAVLYCKNKNLLLIESYHPSITKYYSDIDVYIDVIESFVEVLNDKSVNI